MKIKTLLEMLNRYSPEDELCVLYWDRDNFDYEELTVSAWSEICKEFDEWEDAGLDVSEWLSEAVSKKAEAE
jgi:hypothetical protein